jgi:hypothetical protein
VNQRRRIRVKTPLKGRIVAAALPHYIWVIILNPGAIRNHLWTDCGLPITSIDAWCGKMVVVSSITELSHEL